MADSSITELIDTWLAYLCSIKRYSEHTISAYQMDIMSLFIHMDKHCNNMYAYEDFIKIDHANIRGWLIERKENNISHRSNCRAVAAIKNFARYLSKYVGFIDDKIISFTLRNTHNSLPKPVSLKDIILIMDSMENKNLWIKKRNYVLVMLLYGTGVRISEALNLKINDISDGRFIRVCGKGKKERVIPLIQSLYVELIEYIKLIPKEKSGENYVFCSNRGGKLSRISVAKYFIDIRRSLGLDKHISAHSLRHSFATHLINNDVDLRDIQLMLGHSDITTTEIYTKLEVSSMLESYNKFHPRGGYIKN